MSKVTMINEAYNPNLLVVVDRTDSGKVELHYNLNTLPDTVPTILIDLGDKDVDTVAEECRIRIKELGKCDLKTVLDTIENIREDN